MRVDRFVLGPGGRALEHARQRRRRIARRGRQPFDLRAQRQRVQQRHAALGGELLEALDRPVPYLPRRDVDDTRQTDAVGGIRDHSRVGEDVLDLGALVEPDATDDVVRNGRPAQAVLDDPRLGVCPVENGELVVVARPVGRQTDDAVPDGVGLLVLVRAPDERHLPSLVPLGPELLLLAALVPADHVVGGIEDVAGGPVVLFEPQHQRVGVVVFEVEDVRDVGSAPTVDRLIVVTYDAYVAVLRRQQVDELVLRVARVLVLVDEDVLEAIRVRVEHFGFVPGGGRRPA